MSANTLSFKAAWANIRALAGEVKKPAFFALPTLCAVYQMSHCKAAQIKQG